MNVSMYKRNVNTFASTVCYMYIRTTFLPHFHSKMPLNFFSKMRDLQYSFTVLCYWSCHLKWVKSLCFNNSVCFEVCTLIRRSSSFLVMDPSLKHRIIVVKISQKQKQKKLTFFTTLTNTMFSFDSRPYSMYTINCRQQAGNWIFFILLINFLNHGVRKMD